MIETFATFCADALAALQKRDIPRACAADYFTRAEDADAETDKVLAGWDAYFAKFAKLTDGCCLCCGKSLRCYLGMGLFGGFAWGSVHGEGHCTYCRYPMRGYHCVADLGTISNLFLAYHPSTLAFGTEEKPSDEPERSEVVVRGLVLEGSPL